MILFLFYYLPVVVDYASRYLRWLNYKYGDYRNFAMRDKICSK